MRSRLVATEARLEKLLLDATAKTRSIAERLHGLAGGELLMQAPLIAEGAECLAYMRGLSDALGIVKTQIWMLEAEEAQRAREEAAGQAAEAKMEAQKWA